MGVVAPLAVASDSVPLLELRYSTVVSRRPSEPKELVEVSGWLAIDDADTQC